MAAVRISQVNDEEAGDVSAALTEKQEGNPVDAGSKSTDTKVEVGSRAPVMTDVFSWQHLNYTVTMPDGSERMLLDDISGYVAPGKLTALMGESGAGKVNFFVKIHGSES